MIRDRWYADDRDLEGMLALVRAVTVAHGARAGHLHAGDVVWGLFQNVGIVPSERVRLFERADGELAGFVLLYPPGHFMAEVHPVAPDPAAVLGGMTVWAEAHLTEAATGSDEPLEAVTTELASTDRVTAGWLTGLGYAPTGEADFQLYHQPLDREIPPVAVPEGATVRAVDGTSEAEIAARVELHREVWAPSKFTLEGYRRLRERPVYRPDLDLVSVTPEGELAAYAIVWWDGLSRTGLFEPVGAAERHRGRRYASAVMVEGLRRLRALGASDAVVGCATRPESEPARRLYASTGFDVVLRWEGWRKPLP